MAVLWSTLDLSLLFASIFMKKNDRIQYVNRIWQTPFHSEQLFCLTGYLLILLISKHLCDNDAPHIHTRGMTCHRDALVCLQTLLLTTLPWLHTVAGEFIVVLINCSHPGNQQASNTSAAAATHLRTQSVEENTWKHLHSALQWVCCIWLTLVNKRSLC